MLTFFFAVFLKKPGFLFHWKLFIALLHSFGFYEVFRAY